jgi:hypothetical protein
VPFGNELVLTATEAGADETESDLVSTITSSRYRLNTGGFGIGPPAVVEQSIGVSKLLVAELFVYPAVFHPYGKYS